MLVPIIDLHCDLLSYLEVDEKRTAYDLESCCAIPQLRQGGVKLQMLPVFTQTGASSVKKGLAQAQIYQELPLHYPIDFTHYSRNWSLQSSLIAVLMAFENASSFCAEKEPLEAGLQRLHSIINNIAKPLYISLTWNTENRFGGGSLTRIGLKEDGKYLLEALHQKQIAVDLSHASDALAYEVIDYIEGHNLDIPLMASHSNARAITCAMRNLADDIAKEIFRRKGVVGLNLYRDFIGESEFHLAKHVMHWLELGGKDHLAIGADFFSQKDAVWNNPNYKGRLQGYQDASCYEKLLIFLQKELKLSSCLLEKFAYHNALEFIQTLNGR